MTIMQCNQLAEALCQSPDGPLSAPALSHLNSCPQCHSLWQELEAIRIAGRELGAEEAEPPAYLWLSLRGKLQSEGLIRDANRPGWFADWFGFSPRLAMGGAYVALLLVAVSLVGLHADRPTAMQLNGVEPTNAAPSPSVTADLNKTLDGDIERVVASLSEHDAPLATSVRQNLGVVDNLISLCEQSVREHPDDPIAREYLYGAYQQKATVLAAAIDRSTMENR
jgi:hypothetical protein